MEYPKTIDAKWLLVVLGTILIIGSITVKYSSHDKEKRVKNTSVRCSKDSNSNRYHNTDGL